LFILFLFYFIFIFFFLSLSLSLHLSRAFEHHGLHQSFCTKRKMLFHTYFVLLLNLLPLGFAAGDTFCPGAGNSFGRPNRNATCDYVVIGGGTAGLVVAMRLAEDTSYTVAVVEAGCFYQIENGNQSVTPAYNSEF
jgi:GMC oxidoreductase